MAQRGRGWRRHAGPAGNAQDDQVFDGGSFVLNPGGQLAVQLPSHQEALAHVDFTHGAQGWRADTGPRALLPDTAEQDYRTMALGLGDYLRKSGFSRVVLGLSGGVDSALVATLAADAIGPENVHCVMLPSEYTAPDSLADAADLAARLGCCLDEISIEGPRAALDSALAPLFTGLAPDVTEENLQSRIRGAGITRSRICIKRGCSRYAAGAMPITATGCGPSGEVIPPRIIEKPPSAELRAGQRDDDSLPPYPVLDAILEALVEKDCSVSDLVAQGFARDVVEKVEHLVAISEWKRYQSAPGPRLTDRALWLDRRYPLVNRWRDRSQAPP